MKSIGPYVISATPPGAVVNGHAADRAAESGLARPPSGRRSTDRSAARSAGPARSNPAERAEADSAPLHGLDRLTGMPVLLHRLPEFLVPAALPASASLLPVFEVDVWDGQSYAVTELPLAAIPAIHPDSAALGALRGLVALHAAGQVHGGLNAGQLWQIGRDVRLAGAGLPWQPEAGDDARAAMQAQDLQALARALDTLGVRPAGLDSLETMTAVQALEALETALAEQDRRRGAAPDAPSFSPPAAVVPVPVSPVTLWPVILSPSPLLPAAVHPAPQAAGSATPLPEPSAPPVVPGFVPADAAPEPAPSSAERQAPEPAATPSRYRAADEVIVIGEAAPTVTKSLNAAAPTSTPAPPEASPPTLEPSPARVVRAPIRIGFDEPPVPLLDWTPTDQPITEQPAEARLEQPELLAQDAEPEARNPQPASIPHTPEKLELDGPEQSSEAVLSTFTPLISATTKSPAGAPATIPPRPSGTPAPTPAPTVRSQPLRIGWEEDHSWRVVKSGPERRRVSAPRLPGGTPRLALLALGLLAVAGGWYLYSGQAGVPAAGCCTQSFTVSGSGEPVKVTLVQAPPGSSLQPGALIGTAPGTLKFQGVPGSYVLKFSAAGHRAVDGAVRMPSEKPFGIVLK
ncbi:hypothetical protein [Deinococcus altitudinis]|uniref:hypothetical protein n=1 Tax=Deinococcus altitudinis TaxID=468914 RepID=UPI00389200BC